MNKKSLPRLYNSKKNIKGLGRGVLRDVLSCTVTEVRNDIFMLEMEYLHDGFLADELHIGKIIQANASKRLRKQLFRIYDVKRDILGKMTIFAEHIFFDLRKSFVPRVNPMKKVSLHNALEHVINSSSAVGEYTVNSDVSEENNVMWEFKTGLECIVGSERSILDIWKGTDLYRNNNHIAIKRDRGSDKGVHITYTKNMTGFEATENLDDVVTKIYPYALKEKAVDTDNYTTNSNGSVINGQESAYLKNDVIVIPGVDKYLYAPNHGDFDTSLCIGVDFTDNPFWEKYAMDPANLHILASKYFNETKCNIPKSIYEINLITLADTEEYEDRFAVLEEIELCDTVTVRNKKYGIKEKVKVTELKYDVLKDRVISVKLGGEPSSLSTSINNKLDSLESKVEYNKTEAEKVIEHVTNQITGNNGGHVKLFPPHNPQEIFIMNHEDPMQATEVLRINKKGIGFGSSINGPFKTAWTCDGVFNAEFIRTGSLSANLIKTGILSNINKTIQIDLSSNTIDFYKQISNILQKCISINGPSISFYDQRVNNVVSGDMSIMRAVGSNGEPEYYPTIALNHRVNAYMGIMYQKNDGSGLYTPYVRYDAYNRSGKNLEGYPTEYFGNMKVNGAFCATNGYRVVGNNTPVLGYTTSGKTILKASPVGGLVLADANNMTLLNFNTNGEIGMGASVFNTIKLRSNNSIFTASSGAVVVGSDTGTVLQGTGYKHLETTNSKVVIYKTLDLNGNTIINQRSVNTYVNSKTRSTVNTYNAQSLQEEVSYTFEATTKGKVLRIPLNANIEAFTKNDYMVQLTAYDDCKIWAKKYDTYFEVHTGRANIDFCCRVIKKINSDIATYASRKLDSRVRSEEQCKQDIEECCTIEEINLDDILEENAIKIGDDK